MFRCILMAVLPLFFCLATGVNAQPRFAEISESTRSVAQPYFEAYVARQWDGLEPLLAETGMFTDPTAEPLFGKVEWIGKAAVMKNFREGYAAIKDMRFNQTRTFFSGEHAVFEGTLDWTLVLDDGREVVTLGMPFLTLLHVREGRVQEHRDLADYHPFIQAHQKATTDRPGADKPQ